jgi:class 3 adenylate cyclase
MNENTGRTLVCSVVFLDIVEYTKKPVAEQLHIKQGFNRLLRAALAHVAPRDRVVLDTGDGAALTFLGDPEDALFVAISLRDSVRSDPTSGLKVRIGVNLGPVRLVRDINAQINIIGDGINVAQRIMGFASPGQLLVSRSFHEVVACLSRDYANLFSYEGARTDKHVREHEVYAVGASGPAARRLAETATRGEERRRTRPGWVGELTEQRPFGLHRIALFTASLAFVLFVAGGIAVRGTLNAKPLDSKPGSAAVSPRTPRPVGAAPTKGTPATGAASAKPATAAAAPAAPPAAAGATGSITFAISPWGEVFVNGKSQGVSPPLRSLDLSPGPHTIEVRNTSFPSHVGKVEVRAGEVVLIRHRFH